MFFTDTMKVKKGRRLVRGSVMLKRTAAIVPRVIKAGLSCNWCCVEPVALLATLDLIPPESENHVTGATGERVTTRGSSRVALHTAKSLYQNRENLQAAVAVPVNVPLCKFKVVFIRPFTVILLHKKQHIDEPIPHVPEAAPVTVKIRLAAYG